MTGSFGYSRDADVAASAREQLDRTARRAAEMESFPQLNRDTADEDSFEEAVRFWAERVDEEVRVRRAQPHSLWFAESLFGGGQIHGQLAPVAFATVRTAVDAFTQDPDPKDAPHRRSLSERRADALDDLATFALTHDPDHADGTDVEDDEVDWEAMRAGDTFDGSYPGDDLDEALAGLDSEESDPEVQADVDAGFDPLDPMVVLRRRLRRAEKHRRRRVRRKLRARSGVCTNVHIDLRTLAGIRDIDDLDDVVLRGEGWTASPGAVRPSRGRRDDHRVVLVCA